MKGIRVERKMSILVLLVPFRNFSIPTILGIQNIYQSIFNEC